MSGRGYIRNLSFVLVCLLTIQFIGPLWEDSFEIDRIDTNDEVVNIELTEPQKIALANLNGESENLTGGLSWATTAGGSGGPDYVVDVAIDNSGNVIIAGSVSYNVTLGSLQISSPGGSSAFVAKLNAFGYWTWAVSVSTSEGYSSISAIDVDSNGMIYLAGSMFGQQNAGAYTIGSVDEYGFFVGKLNPQGAWVWVQDVLILGDGSINGISVDGSGNVGIVGTYSGDLYFPSPNLQTTGGDYDIFVAKLSSGGNSWIWVESFGGIYDDWGAGIDLWSISSGNEGDCNSNQNNFVITGSFTNSIVFGDENYTTNRYSSSAYVTWLCGGDGSVFSSLVEGVPSDSSTVQFWSTFNSWSRDSGWYSGYNVQDGLANGFSAYYLYSYIGNYPSSLSSTVYATSPTVSGFGYSSSSNYFLEFDRMLGIESNVWDDAFIEVYYNNYWYTIWSNPSSTIDESGNKNKSWTKIKYDISNYFPGNSQFKVRFGIGPTDEVVQYTGWAIDNVRITQGERYVDGMSFSDSIVSRGGGTTQSQSSCVVIGGSGMGDISFDNGYVDFTMDDVSPGSWIVPVCTMGEMQTWIPFSNYETLESGETYISDLSIDSSDKIVISGMYMGGMYVGSDYLSPFDSADIFIASINGLFSSSSDWEDAYRGGGYGDDFVSSHVVTQTGSTIVVGNFDGSSQFGNTYLSAKSEEDGLIAQISSAGTWAWAKQIGGEGGVDYSTATEGLSDGRVAIGGSFQGIAEFGDTNLSSNGGFDGFIAIYNNDGSLDKIQSYGYEGDQQIVQLQQEESGSLYAVGNLDCISNSVYIFGKWVSCPNNSGEGEGLFVAKLDLDLNADWVTGIGLGEGGGEIISLGELSDGSLAICGTHFDGDIEIGSLEEENSLEGVKQLICSKLSSANGNPQWISRADMSDRYEEMWVRDLVVDSQDNIVVTGNFMGTASFGSVSTIASAGNEDTYDLFTASISSNGYWNWAIAGGGQDSDTGNSILIDDDGKYRIYGSMTGSAAIGSTMLTGSDSESVYPITATITNNGVWSSAEFFDHNGKEASAFVGESLTDSLQLVWFVYDAQLTLDNSMMLGPQTGDYRMLGIGLFNSSLDKWVGVEDIIDLESSNLQGWISGLDSSAAGYVTFSGYYNGGTNAFLGQSAITDGSYNAFLLSYELDTDLDGILNSEDFCEYGATGWVSDYATDHDSDGCKDSDIEDLDDDNDGVLDPIDELNPTWGEDLCSRGLLDWISNSSNDYDNDGCKDSDIEDLDDDNDGITDPVIPSDPISGEDFCHKGLLNWTSESNTDWDSDGCNDDSSEDLDDDNDGILDPVDVNSPLSGEDYCYRGLTGWISNNNTDHDSDGCKDGFEDQDNDNDGVNNQNDLCVNGLINWDSNNATDYDSDGCQDVTEDLDDDNDSVTDLSDSCVKGDLGWVSDYMTDHDGDGCRDDGEDLDDDNDGVIDGEDLCHSGQINWLSNQSSDYDSDGCQDVTEDLDDDNDGVDDPSNVEQPNDGDYCYKGDLDWVSNSSSDHDGDGCRDDGEDLDDDNDGILDNLDLCPRGVLNWISSSINDYDSDGCQDVTEDLDDDNDGVLDDLDDCDTGALGWTSTKLTDHDRDGCRDSDEDEDDDNDGLNDNVDYCKKSIGVDENWTSVENEDYDGDGCRDSDEDEDDDNDGISDRNDGCSVGETDWVSSSNNDADGDGCKDDIEDLDDDGDGVEDSKQFMLTGEGAAYTWMIIGGIVTAILVILLVYRFARGGSSTISNSTYREIENEVRQEIEFERIEKEFSENAELDMAMREFPHWSRNEIQEYFDQGWTIESLRDWLRNSQ